MINKLQIDTTIPAIERPLGTLRTPRTEKMKLNSKRAMPESHTPISKELSHAIDVVGTPRQNPTIERTKPNVPMRFFWLHTFASLPYS